MSLATRIAALIAAIGADIKALATGKVDGTDPRLTNARTPTSHTHTAADISNSTATGRALMTAADAPAVRSTLELANHQLVEVDSTGATMFRSKFGYTSGVGAGSGVLQTDSKSQPVGMNAPTGVILLHDQTMAAGASVEFTFYNSFIGDHDLLLVSHYLNGMTDKFEVSVVGTANGGATLRVRNITAFSQSGSPQIKFAVIKGAVT